MKKLLLYTWEDFNELLSSVDFHRLSSGKKLNPALTRWSLHFQKESDNLSKFSAQVSYDKIALLASSEWHLHFSKGHVDKIKKFQQDYLNKASALIKESLNSEIAMKHNKIVDAFNINKNFGACLSKKKEGLLGLVKGFTVLSTDKLFLRKILINAPIGEVVNKLRLAGYMHPIKNKAMGNSYLGCRTDSEIVTYFNTVILNVLKWYSGADNFGKIKGLAQLLRRSCILTLANKHKKSIR
jgi:Type II intron maturase